MNFSLILDAVMQTPITNRGSPNLTKAQPDWQIARNVAAQESAKGLQMCCQTPRKHVPLDMLRKRLTVHAPET
jgi:hypothetical protein